MSETFTFNITEEGLKRSQRADEGWYLLEVKEANKELSSKKDSFNLVVDLSILQSENGDKTWAGKPLRIWLNEKAMEFPVSISFLTAVGVDTKPGSYNLTPGNLVGKKLLGYVTVVMGRDKSGNETGQLVNAINDFRRAA